MESPLVRRSFHIFLCIAITALLAVQVTKTVASTEVANEDAKYFFYQRSEYPKDCKYIMEMCTSKNASGVYIIKPDGFHEPFEVFCNQDIDSGGWTVIQRRENDIVNFNRSWSHYKEGFGFLSTEFWLGNDKLSYLTNQAVYELRIDFQLVDGSTFYTSYKGFRISDEFGQYSLNYIGTIESNAGNLISSCPTNMEYKLCTCQGTCEDPTGENGCYGNCSSNEGCVCPNGYLMHDRNCILRSDCGCFVSDAAVVVPEGGTYVNDDCTRKCLCSNNQLTCDEAYTCGSNAECTITNNERQCSCSEGYEGDGQICQALYTDCKDVYDAGHTQHGVYTILPTGWPGGPFSVYCRMDNGGGWTVFQRHIDDSTEFYRNWDSYRDGFGDLNTNFWIGNEKLYYLTNQKGYKLRFDITTSSGAAKYAEYPEFQVESNLTNYRMNKLGDRSSGNTGNQFHHSRGKQFSTYDRDNDECGNFNCAEEHRSGWWHSTWWCNSCDGPHCVRFHYGTGSCHTVCTGDNPNGEYNGVNGQNIYSWGDTCTVTSFEMKIHPNS